MAVPAGGEIAIYDSSIKEHQYRLVSGLDYPAWTAEKSETFSTALSSTDWWFTQYLSASPDVSGGSLNIRSFGSPLRELVISRPHWFPSTDLETIGFKATVNATFPLTGDPVYSPTIVFGGTTGPPTGAEPTGYFGQDHEPYMIVQKGGAFRNGINNGKMVAATLAQSGINNIGNDGLSHEYEVEWDPDGATGSKLVMRYDGVDLIPVDTGVEDRPPRYIAFGGIWEATEEAVPDGVLPPLGSVDSPVTVLQVHDVTVTQHASDGYESRTYPGWTSANAGGTLDTAADGERFSLDSETWAKIPQANVDRITVNRYRDGSPDSINVTLRSNDTFTPSRMVNRPLLLDTRVSDETTFTAWKRQGCFIVERVERVDDVIRITGRDRPSNKLDAFISKSFVSIDPGTDTSGEIDQDKFLTWAEIFGVLIEISDAVAGDVLGTTDSTIYGPDITPLVLSTGGQSLLPVLTEWADRLVCEVWRQYATSGTNRYGGWRINAWTFGTGTGGYTFTGRGGTGSDVVEGGNRYVVDRQQGFGQVIYRNDNPIAPGTPTDIITRVPVLGHYPTWPWPPESRVLEDSMAASVGAAGLAVSALTQWKDSSNGNVDGGIAYHRYRRENLQRRKIQLKVIGHDWIEPGDEITFNDPDGTEVVTADGGWVVDNLTLDIANSTITTSFNAHTSNLSLALLETL